MKAIYKAWTLSGLMLLCAVFFICSKLDAQTIISIESLVDSSVVMKIQNENISENTQKVILILDNSLLTYQFSEGDVYAFSESQHNFLFQPATHKSNTEESKSYKQNKDILNYLVEKTLDEDSEEEDSMEVEDWMYSSENWLSENK